MLSCRVHSLARVALAVTALSPWSSVKAQDPGGQYYKIDTKEDILESARTLAYDMMTFYTGNQTGMIPGILPGPPTEHLGDYFWWEGGAMMGTYVDYWHLTGDTSYNEVVTQGMLHQVGEHRDYQPKNHTLTLGNDDQGFWGMSAMLAAENKFPNPPKDQPQWLALAQAVWVTQADPSRHDDECGGGLHWQIPSTNAGYDYKNTIANACFFDLGARLARYTGNDTYAKHSEETWDWLWSVQYIDNKAWHVYDGGHVPYNCTDIDETTYSYNAALMIHGAAYMYSYTKTAKKTESAEKWKGRLDKLLDAFIDRFFPDGILFEYNCEQGKGYCKTDQLSFKGYVHRWLAVVTQIAPHTADLILPVLKSSTEAAVKQCTGGETGRVCGFYWSKGEFVDPGKDLTSGAGEAMNVLAAVSSLLIDEADGPVTKKTGGISEGDPNAGVDSEPPGRVFKPITIGDKVGAGILTAVVAGMALGMFAFMLF